MSISNRSSHCQLPLATLGKISDRAQLLQRSTPHMRFRAMWDGFGHNDWCKLKSQKELNVMIILIQALGEGKSAIDKPDISLHSALKEL
ncbi:hypothetical protein PGT21_014318 [Puccinia graminis f. sp. tritici]|nr:hypothetical protein PGTUg99_001264 [Puccinia graminis f. sp. tritici]KAA1097634.1 hypothetical protein PGT21_014906 [Puccinia graminis f. sp. tritici]KAA1101261.1 hypothetical protein PGT21_014318 [Puccinia graminis f. sp. tritici]KAA1134453.1 hypothetical protein PGTUg99_001551 [Puccinia graminis f. sp. tritici]